MGKIQKGKDMRQLSARSAAELFPGGVPSAPYALGRRLRLYFEGGNRPELDRIEFEPKGQQKGGFLQRGFNGDKELSFRWTEMPKALSLFFLEYLIAGFEKRPFAFRRTPQTRTLADAAVDTNGKLFRLFVEELPTGGTADKVDRVFNGVNLNRTDDRERSVFVNTEYLPQDCVEIFFEGRRLTDQGDVIRLAGQFRKVWEMPPPCELEFKIGEASFPPSEPATSPPPGQQPRQPELLPEVAPRQQPPKESPAQPGPAPQAEAFKLSKFLAEEFGKALDVLRTRPGPASKADTRQPTAAPADKEEARLAKPADGEEAKPADQPRAAPEPEAPEPPPIAPELFVVPQANGSWPDEAPLVELPGEETAHAWTLKNAFEGILILGRTGSGKTTGSGSTFAEAFLRAGFGGLVLTVKAGEADYWRRLCAWCGREDDLVVVERGGNWKLNLLAYEAQHPGRGGALSENLTTFCRNLLAILSRSKGASTNEQFWESAGDQLLNATFDLFLLAGGGITFDRLADFVAAAPTDKVPKTEEDWLKVPTFGGVYREAKQAAVSPEDKRIFGRASQYWLTIYPGLSSKTRTSVTLGVYAMFDTFRGRDMPALISSETNLAPESIMGGKIVVLDLPLKELQHAGLMVQSAWKYLFQVALERQKRSNIPACRPVFLWEDEGQHFFSQHDHHFQNTARSARVCRVILTQNLHSFIKEFGRDGESATMTVFGNLNTKVFHNNSDTATNRWAAEQFGKVINQRLSISQGSEPQSKSFLDALRQSFDPPDRTSVSSAEHWEDAVRPEEFNDLRTGGPEYNFMVDAYITWMGLTAEDGNHFLKISFQQNQNL
jgi:hypothetical protein